MSADRTEHLVIDYRTGDVLPGEPTRELIAESLDAPEGYVYAHAIGNMWFFVPRQSVESMRRAWAEPMVAVTVRTLIYGRG